MTLYEELKARGLVDDLLIGDLSYQTAGFQFFVQRHGKNLLFLGQRKQKTPSAKIEFGRGRDNFAVPPLFAVSSRERPYECTPQSRVTLLRL